MFLQKNKIILEKCFENPVYYQDFERVKHIFYTTQHERCNTEFGLCCWRVFEMCFQMDYAW